MLPNGSGCPTEKTTPANAPPAVRMEMAPSARSLRMLGSLVEVEDRSPRSPRIGVPGSNCSAVRQRSPLVRAITFADVELLNGDAGRVKAVTRWRPMWQADFKYRSDGPGPSLGRCRP